MNAREALVIARSNEVFRRHYDRVMTARLHKEPTACIIFAINDETYYFGFDGVDIHLGKHSKKRSQAILRRGDAFVIG